MSAPGCRRLTARQLRVGSSVVNDTPTDQSEVVAEITAEVNRQRAESTAAAVDEAAIIAAFDDLAPAGAVGDDGAASIARLASVAHINVDVPTGSNRAALVPVKKGLRKLQAWYLRYVTDQINVALGLTVGSLEDHEKRLAALDSRFTAADLGINPPVAPSQPVVDAVAGLMSDTPDVSPSGGRLRVMSAWCGDGSFVSTLIDRGFDAYGIDTDADGVSAALRQGLDARYDDPVEHLGELPAGSLSGLVIGSAMDVMRVADIAGIIDLARRAVADNGRIVIVADTEPTDPARFELAERSPLSAVAWLRLLAARHIEAEVVRSAPGDLTVFAGRP